jgi:hypothetical protein
MESETRLTIYSSAMRTLGTPRTFLDPSSTPTATAPPPVLANATRVLRIPSGDDKSRMYSSVLPSWRFSSSTSLIPRHFTRKPLPWQDCAPQASHFRLSATAACANITSRVHKGRIRLTGSSPNLCRSDSATPVGSITTASTKPTAQEGRLEHQTSGQNCRPRWNGTSNRRNGAANPNPPSSPLPRLPRQWIACPMAWKARAPSPNSEFLEFLGGGR